MTIKRRLENVERRLAKGLGEWIPDMELLSHSLEREAAAAGKSLETFLAEREPLDLTSPEREPGETWHQWLTRYAAMSGVSLVELRAVISEWEEQERAIIALERSVGLPHGSGSL